MAVFSCFRRLDRKGGVFPKMIIFTLAMAVLTMWADQSQLVRAQGNSSTPSPTAPSTEGGRAGRIVGGFQLSSMKRYPFQVALTKTNKGNFVCGGTIIDANYVLTAGHCFPQNVYAAGVVHSLAANAYSIRYGDVEYKKGTKIDAEKLWIHPSFSFSPSIRNDVAILKLKNAIAFSASATPILLASDDSQLGANADLAVSGWGFTSEGGNIVSKLRATVVDYLPNTCGQQNVYSNLFLPSVMLCAGCGTGVKKTCTGDSGGPVVTRSASGSCPILVGIVSWGYDCGDLTHPSVLTRVSAFVDWVEGIVGKPLRSAAQINPSTNCEVCGSTTSSACGESPDFNETRCALESAFSKGFTLTVGACTAGKRTASAAFVSPPTSFKSGKVFFLRSTAGAGNAVVKVNGVDVNTPLKAPVQVSAAVSSTANSWQLTYNDCPASSARHAAIYFSNGQGSSFYKVSLAVP